jgi:Cytochrome c554 and c-prime
LLRKPGRRKTMNLVMPAFSPRTVHLCLTAAIAVSVIAAPIAGSAAASGASTVSAGAERRVTLFYTGAVRGTLEPCGCTSDPLGDIARMATIVRQAGKASLLLDAGNLLYAGESVPEARAEGADLQAAFLAAELAKLPLAGAGLGEADLARGPGRVVPRRLAANADAGDGAGAPFLQPSQLRTVGGIKIGVLGVADPELLRRHGLKAEDPAAAAARESARLRQQGAEIVVILAAVERAAARRLARGSGADFVVVGANPGMGMVRADPIDGSFVVAPAEELQMIGRIDVVLRDPPGRRPALIDAGGVEARELERAALRRRLGQLEGELARWEKQGPTIVMDRAFVDSRKRERSEVVRTLAELERPFVAPATGSYFTNQLIPLRRALPRDARLAAAMRKLDQKVGAANLRKAGPPPPAEPGRAAFVGDGACASCHKPAMAFWRTTVHASAWKTIVDGGKTGIADCVSCHVTGFGEVGGSSLGHVKGLTSVQCETCHGPGSLHVKAEGLEEPPAVRLSTPESTCQRCHNEKHSDTFQYAAYLRDVLGPGHGAKAREKLGPGPTGHQLRSRAVAAAKAAGKAQLKKM